MSLENWDIGSAQKLDPNANTSVLLEKGNGENPVRFVANTPNGEVLIALGKEENIRISMQRENDTYCLFQLSLESLVGFFKSGMYGLTDLRDAIYEDPIISGLTRAQATELLGIAK